MVSRGFAALFVLLAVLAGYLLTREFTVRAAQDDLLRDVAALDRGSVPSIDPAVVPSLQSPARALLPEATRRALVAVRTPGAARQRLLEQALTLVDAAIAQRPFWGEAQVARAFILTERDGADAASTKSAVARSYAEAPYLRDGAGWRIGYGLQHWEALSLAARNSWVEEAIWFSRIQPGVREQLFRAVRGTGGYVPLLLRWREVRAGDADVRRGR